MEVKCKTQHTLPLEELTEFQGNLKERDSVDVGKIMKSIRKHGFSFPFFVWNHDAINHVLDGHGRLLALKQMAKDGENIPELPIVYGITTRNFWRVVNQIQCEERNYHGK